MTFSCHVFIFFQSVEFQKNLKCSHLIKLNYIMVTKLSRKRPCFFLQRSWSLWVLLGSIIQVINGICITVRAWSLKLDYIVCLGLC